MNYVLQICIWWGWCSAGSCSPVVTMTTDISVGVRWDPLNGQDTAANGGNGQIEDFDFEYDGGNSSSRLFERSRIRALAGE